VEQVDWGQGEVALRTSLVENDAVRMAMAIQDYEHVSVSDIGGHDALGYWLTIRDDRFGLEYDITSHFDYWDFISHYAAGVMWTATPLPRSEVA
jgi:hypothetical protein